jgi:hypothetical protein
VDEISSGVCGASVGGTEPRIHNPSFNFKLSLYQFLHAMDS